MWKSLNKFVYWTLVVAALIQFVPVNRTNRPVDSKINFADVKNTPPKIREMLRNACYDCHSDETVYPDYAYIAPVSWSIKHHINEGREHLNFSVWASLNADLRRNMLENSVADMQQNRMPLPGYIVYHPKANLTAAERKLLVDYLSKMLNSGNY